MRTCGERYTGVTRTHWELPTSGLKLDKFSIRTFGAIRTIWPSMFPWLNCLPVTPPIVWLIETAEANSPEE